MNNEKQIDAYPLQWPEGWQRAKSRGRARFNRRAQGAAYAFTQSLTVADAIARVLGELQRMGVGSWNVIISTNVETRRDGLPYSNAKAPADPGVAVYWRDSKTHQRRCMAIDQYDRVADNLAAIAATLDAMRAIERHGGAEILDRAFTGFVALPSPEQPWQVLGVAMTAGRGEIETAHRRLAMQHHPDRGGGDAQMARINAARDAMIERLSRM